MKLLRLRQKGALLHGLWGGWEEREGGMGYALAVSYMFV